MCVRGTERRAVALINSIVAPSDAIWSTGDCLKRRAATYGAKETKPQPIHPHLVDHVR